MLPDLLGQRDGLKADIKTAAKAVEAIDAEFKHRLGPNEAALLAGGRRVTFKTQSRKGHYVAPSESRVLRFNTAR